MNPQDLLKQLALAKQAGMQAHAKSFFAKVPGADSQEPGATKNAPAGNPHAPSGPGDKGPEMAEAGGDSDNGPQAPGVLGGVETNKDASNIDPQQLEELLAALGAKDEQP